MQAKVDEASLDDHKVEEAEDKREPYAGAVGAD